MSVDPIRERLDDAEAWLREEFAPAETELAAFAALRAVLDLHEGCCVGEIAPSVIPLLRPCAEVRAIAQALGVDP